MKGWRVLLATGLAISGMIVIDPLSLLGKLKLFPIENVKFQSGNHVTLEHIETRCAPLRGRDTLTISLKPLQTCVESFGWVERARISRQLPHTLSIEIEEREPLAVAMIQQKWVYVTEGAEPMIAPVELGQLIQLPLISQWEQWTEVQKIDALGIAKTLKNARLAQRTSEIFYQEQKGWFLQLESGQTVLLGDAVPTANIKRLHVILERFASHLSKRSAIDLRSDKKIIVKGVNKS